MSTRTIRERLPRFFQPFQPTVAFEVSGNGLAAVRLERDGRSMRLGAYFDARLPPGIVRPSPSAQNVLGPDALRPLLEEAVRRVIPEHGPVALALPDAVVRLALVNVETVPRKREEIEELVSWRIKKMLPFRPEEGVLRTEVHSDGKGAHVLLAAAVRRKVLAEYESLLEGVGLQAGRVTVSSLALADWLQERDDEDVALVNVGAGWFSVLITSGGHPIFHRTKAIPDSESASPALEAFVARQLYPTLEYYRGRLGRQALSRVFVQGGGESLSFTVEDSLEAPTERLDIPLAGTLPTEAAPHLAVALALAWRGAGRLAPGAAA